MLIQAPANEPSPTSVPIRPENQLEGVVRSVIFRDESRGFAIVAISTDDGSQKALGPLASVSPGETVRLVGSWVDHDTHGRQFRADDFETVVPTTALGVQAYLAEVDGVGPVLASRIVEALGPGALNEIAQHPGRLADVPGIGESRALAVATTVRDRREADDLAIELRGFGVPKRFVSAVVSRYKGEAIEQVRQDPYALIGQVKGLGFKTADLVARNVGIPRRAPQRVGAGVLEVLRRASAEGHCAMLRAELAAAAAQLLAVPRDLVDEQVDVLRGSRMVVEEDGGWVFSARLHRAEWRVADRLRAILTASKREVAADEIAAPDGFELGSEQRTAVLATLEHGATILTGGPGTGKTTTIRTILETFERAGHVVRMTAPTGRAARRMAEAVGTEGRSEELWPSTIHVLLEYDPAEHVFRRNLRRQLDADLVIVDEASMVDVTLANHLLAAVPDGCRLLIVGDSDQLPSVGPGKVLEDLVESGAIPTTHLREIFRQAKDSGIVVNAHRVNDGRSLVVEDFAPSAWRFPKERGGRSDFYFFERQSADGVLSTVVELVSRRLPEQFDLEPIREVQVLAPQKTRAVGVVCLNEKLQAAINPDGEPIPGQPFRVGDRVMQTRNDRGRGINNGDTGRILSWSASETSHVEGGRAPKGQAVLELDDGRVVLCSRGQLSELTLAYAITFHKSQGSEYKAVVLVVDRRHWWMLRRKLVYTGMTRGRELVVVVGQRQSMRHATRNTREDIRTTRLAARLSGEAGTELAPVCGNAPVEITPPEWECDSCLKSWAEQQPQRCPHCEGRSFRRLEIE